MNKTARQDFPDLTRFGALALRALDEIDRLREQNANLIKDVLKQREEVTRLRTVIDNHRHHGTPL